MGERYIRNGNLQFHVHLFSLHLLLDSILYQYSCSLAISDDSDFLEGTELIGVSVEVVEE